MTTNVKVEPWHLDGEYANAYLHQIRASMFGRSDWDPAVPEYPSPLPAWTMATPKRRRGWNEEEEKEEEEEEKKEAGTKRVKEDN